MKVTKVNHIPELKMVAIIGASHGIYLPKEGGGHVFINGSGIAAVRTAKFEVIESSGAGTPVYEGEAIQLTFN